MRKYAGHSQSKHVIRSCFGGVEGNFVVSGSEGTSSGISSPILSLTYPFPHTLFRFCRLHGHSHVHFLRLLRPRLPPLLSPVLHDSGHGDMLRQMGTCTSGIETLVPCSRSSPDTARAP